MKAADWNSGGIKTLPHSPDTGNLIAKRTFANAEKTTGQCRQEKIAWRKDFHNLSETNMKKGTAIILHARGNGCALVFSACSLRQTFYFSVYDVYVQSMRLFGQSGHTHDFSSHHYQHFRTGIDHDVAHMKLEAFCHPI